MSEQKTEEKEFVGKTVKLQPPDAEEPIVTPIEVAQMSVTIKNMIVDLELDVNEQTDVVIPLQNVRKDILEKVVEYATHHYLHDEPVEGKNALQISPWDKTFTDSLPKSEKPHEKLFELILAANYLDIKPLLDLTCKTVAYLCSGRTPEEIRKEFGVLKEFTPADYDEIREEFHWARDENKEKS